MVLNCKTFYGCLLIKLSPKLVCIMTSILQYRTGMNTNGSITNISSKGDSNMNNSCNNTVISLILIIVVDVWQHRCSKSNHVQYLWNERVQGLGAGMRLLLGIDDGIWRSLKTNCKSKLRYNLNENESFSNILFTLLLWTKVLHLSGKIASHNGLALEVAKQSQASYTECPPFVQANILIFTVHNYPGLCSAFIEMSILCVLDVLNVYRCFVRYMLDGRSL